MRWIVGSVVVGVLAAGAGAVGPPDAEAWKRFEKIEEALRDEKRGAALYRLGKLAEATKIFAKVLDSVEGLYPDATYPQGHPELARSLNNLAYLYQAQGVYAKAESLYRRALEMRERLYPKAGYPQGHLNLILSLNNLATLHQAQGEFAKAGSLSARALDMGDSLYPMSRYPQGHPYVVICLNNLATVYSDQGDYAKAGPLLARALAIREKLYSNARYPHGHPALATSLNNLATLREQQGDYAKAEPLFRRALELYQGLYPKAKYPLGHPDLATSLNNLAELYRAQGEFAKAEPLYRRALEMDEGLYPKAQFPQGHPDLAMSLNNLAGLYRDRGEFAKAVSPSARALAMYERLYPKARYPHGHPHLARSLNDLALVVSRSGDYAKAGQLYTQALEMYEGLYPKTRYPQGHPDLARSLNNLAGLHLALGDYAKAERLCARALKMREALYPKTRYPQGHPELALALNNLAELHRSQGEYAKAEPLYTRALAMYSDSATSLAASSSEATALNYAASNPLTRDGYLSATNHLPKSDAYPAVWQSKAVLARVYEQRHLAVLAASSKEARELWDAILSLKRERARLLLAPADAAKAKARDKRLDEIDEAIRKKEVDLLPMLPAMKRSDELAKSTPADLCKALPANTAFVDLVRYVRFAQDTKVPGTKGEKRTPHYVAFVVTRAGVTRVELGEAKPIEETFDLWRRALVEGSPSEPKYAALVHGLIWSPLVKHLPAKMSAVFVSPDAALNKLPWAALRDGKTNRILIEDFAVAVMPHGPMLLDRLTEGKRKPGTGTLLAMGGVVYDKEAKATTELALRGPVGEAVTWPLLAGTAKELTQVVELAGKRKVIRREGTAASAPTILADLPQAETAHLATHGFFADPKFRTAMQFDEKLFGRGHLGERSGAGSRSPLILSGIVCSGANLPGTPNRGVLTAEAIVGLDLRKMNLAVLSACETGLGDVAGGEGVYGLARAFHVAGTRNVVASLWKVDDEATAALMVLFYRQLWGKEKVAPMEAMRRAQVSLYRNPGRIAEWSQGRGPLPTPVEGGETTPAEKGPKGKTSPARAWAAFVISGPGD